MNRLGLLLATVVVCQYGTLGKAVYGDLLPDEHLEISDPLNPASRSMGPESSPLVKIRGVEAEHSAEPASLCYFIQESEIESQISCRLRFTRSKFNFNPFGLRFGKRDQGSITMSRRPVSGSSTLLPYLLHLKQTRLAECMQYEDC
uniref:Kisspeptin 2 n=1 Tax=Acipenser dabryanus TaxID=62061 RepID=A0A481PBT5_ACIDA|nr:kisspeptin 2 [Acipenser dabryanus]